MKPVNDFKLENTFTQNHGEFFHSWILLIATKRQARLTNRNGQKIGEIFQVK